MRYPTIKALSNLFIAMKSSIEDEFRASDYDTLPSMQVTIGFDRETGKWAYQTGDNSFSGAAYGFNEWAVVSLYRRSNSKDLARDVLNQLHENG